MKPFPDLPTLPTTVVGSYPVVPGKGISRFLDPFSHSVRIAVEDQIAAGIDLISDGQVRGDMVRVFTSRLPGIRGQEVTGKILPSSGAITLRDTRYALSRHRFVKGILTGPTTLSHALHISTPMYRDRNEVALDMAKALKEEASSLERAGVCMIQVDEPILSTGAADMEAARNALEVVTSGLSIPVSLHVCGDLSKVIDFLLAIPVDVLDIECAKSPANLDLLDRRDLCGRRIGLGCVDSTSNDVEPIDVIRSRIRHGIDLLGPDSLFIDPDCGLRMLSRESASLKLSRMSAATREVRKELLE
ncbi:MAG: methionine synthase [Methanolinea sp.]|nr:methionine synthase [Methanolinea sp.]